MKLIAATNNLGKIKEIKSILGELGFEVISQKEAGIEIEVEENGATFKENALLKAMAVYNITHTPVIADDSGLCVDYLNGAPGIYSARYAGENATDSNRIEKLLTQLSDVEYEKRDAHFTSAVAFVMNESEYYCTEGNVFGKILTAPEGDGGFGYDPIFYCTELEKTFGNASPEEKNRISHRFRALMQMKEVLKEKL